MNDMMLWLGLAVGEVLLVLLVLLVAYWVRNSGRARRDRKAMARLVATVRKGKEDREAAIGSFLSQAMGLDGRALVEARVAIMREELRLLNRFVDVYGRRDAGAASQFHLDVEAATAPYLELRGAMEQAPEGAVDTAELEALREENARLCEELSVTMDTMSRMLAEYSAMFAAVPGSEVPEPAVPVDEAPSAMDELPEREVSDLDEGQLDIAADGDPVAAESEPKAEAVTSPESPETESPAEEVREEGVEDTVVAQDASSEAQSARDQASDESRAGEAETEEEGGAAEDEAAVVDPLEEGLDSLFDDDDIAVLDDDTDAGLKKGEDGAIAI